MTRLLDPALRSRLAAGARARARDLDFDVHGERVLALYAGLGAPRARRACSRRSRGHERPGPAAARDPLPHRRARRLSRPQGARRRVPARGRVGRARSSSPTARSGSSSTARPGSAATSILMPGVVIGRADSWIPPDRVAHLGGRVVIGDDVTVGAGAKVLYAAGQELVVAEGTVVGANAVLRESTGPYEIWAGIPARRVGLREREGTEGSSDDRPRHRHRHRGRRRLARAPPLDAARRRRDGRVPADGGARRRRQRVPAVLPRGRRARRAERAAACWSPLARAAAATDRAPPGSAATCSRSRSWSGRPSSPSPARGSSPARASSTRRSGSTARSATCRCSSRRSATSRSSAT